jgi:hypothetical protein
VKPPQSLGLAALYKILFGIVSAFVPVYFASEGDAPVFRREDLLVRVGAKETTDPIPVRYCFGFKRTEVQRRRRNGAVNVPRSD